MTLLLLLLNQYIVSEPTQADAYKLRAVCFEGKEEFEIARLDYRRALVLEVSNPMKYHEYESNLKKMIDKWYPQLENKIKYNLNKLETDSNNPLNYLEIGNAYRLMEEWTKAIQWYDGYLQRDQNASVENILLYTSILAKSGEIIKGESILKKYVEKFFEDSRLWSRYGYFTMWLYKNQIAKNAFETALKLKPDFQEAQDGLNLVNKLANRKF